MCLGYPELPSKDNAVEWLKVRGAAKVDVVDVIAHFGMERIVDLNYPQEWPQRYGLVINPGTLEHCFNIGQAWENTWRAVLPHGFLVNVAPASMLNHGFWNVCPSAVYDWCEANGGEVISLKFAINHTGREVAAHRIGTSSSGRGALPEETVMYALMKKARDVPLRWPAQGVYRR